jgi:hypothetical protein
MYVDKITVHLALPFPEGFTQMDHPAYPDSFYSALEDLVASSGVIKFPLFGLGEFSPEIHWVRDEIELCKIEDQFPSAGLKGCEDLIVSIEVPYEEEENAESSLPDIILKRISDLLIIANLCHPGTIELKESEIMQNGILKEYSHLPEMDGFPIQLAVEFASQIAWPKIYTLDLIGAWNWHLKRGNFLELEGFENDPISRALNAFSRLFETPTMDATIQLVWAMVGIEALYVREQTYVKRQVREKVAIALGQNPIFNEEFGKAYAFRSRFIHGSQDFPGFYHLGDAGVEIEKYYKDQERTVSFAIAILVASLQEIIKGNWRTEDAT